MPSGTAHGSGTGHGCREAAVGLNPPKKCSGLLGKVELTCSAWCWWHRGPASSTCLPCASTRSPARAAGDRDSRLGTGLGTALPSPTVRAALREAPHSPSLGNILSHHICKPFCKQHLQCHRPRSPGSSRTRTALSGRPSQPATSLLKPERFLFLLPTVRFLSGGCTSRRDHLPPAGSKRSEGQGNVEKHSCGQNPQPEGPAVAVGLGQRQGQRGAMSVRGLTRTAASRSDPGPTARGCPNFPHLCKKTTKRDLKYFPASCSQAQPARYTARSPPRTQEIPIKILKSAGAGGMSVHPWPCRVTGIANKLPETSLSHLSHHRLSGTIIHAGSRPPSPLLISTYLHILLKIKILLHFFPGLSLEQSFLAALLDSN